MFEYIDQIKSAIKTSRNALLNLSEIEIKVLDATTNEPWGPTSTEMREIARASHSYHNFPLIMGIIWKRLADETKWRHIYKGLVLLEYLIKLGSDQVIRESRAHIMDIQFLCEYKCIEEENTDVGASVREKARNVSDLLHDEERIKREREKARQSISKYMSYESSETFNRYSSGSSYDSEQSRAPRDRQQYEDEYNRSSSSVRSSSSSSPNLSRASTSRAGGGGGGGGTDQPRKVAPVADLLNISELLPAPNNTNTNNTHNNTNNNNNNNNNNTHNNDPNSTFPAFEINFPKPVAQQSTSLPILQPIPSPTPPPQTLTPSNLQWAAFEETNDTNTSQGPPSSVDPNDPWAHKNLFDFGDLNKNSSSNSSQKPKTSIGALTGAAVKPQMAPTTLYPNLGPVYQPTPAGYNVQGPFFPNQNNGGPFVIGSNYPVGNVGVPQQTNSFSPNVGGNRNSSFGF